MPPRTVALVAAVCVTIGWLLAATLTPPVARLQSLADSARSPATLDEPPLTERLNFRLREIPAAPTLRRNPFSFGSRARTSAPVGDSEPAPVDAPRDDAAPVPRPPAFGYSLSGIAIAGNVRSAVLTDGTAIHIVKVNDTFAGYTVVEITDESVTLESSTTRKILRFAQ